LTATCAISKEAAGKTAGREGATVNGSAEAKMAEGLLILLALVIGFAAAFLAVRPTVRDVGRLFWRRGQTSQEQEKRRGRKPTMSELVVGGVVAAGLLVYLVYALLRAEGL
jgi:K+-transporting ATPase KdpF subunit